jgi:hypothetical protein
MERNTIDAVCSQVYRDFPEMRGVSPKVKAQGSDQHLLIFQGNATTANGLSLSRTVRVVVNTSGKILKISTSR